MFEQSILVSPRGSARGASFALSLGSQMLFLGTALILPLFFIEGPSVIRLNDLLVAPPPPPPPPPSIKLVAVPNVIRRMIDGVRIFAPSRIPTEVAKIVETDLPPVDSMPDVGVPGGSIGGRHDGIINSIANQAARQAPPPAVAEKPVAKDPPPAPKEIARVRTGGDVQAAKLVKRIIPLYPPLAKQARISGTVKLMGIIARDGRIINLQVLSGHPLLVPAAVDAVRQWVYQPTLLNDEPVEVVAPIDVNFTLH
ncbi:MAG: energy transducer TonB [Bryobacterales bacterium]|nr:energy transducer TonB [Bryobacterales bacterium]